MEGKHASAHARACVCVYGGGVCFVLRGGKTVGKANSGANAGTAQFSLGLAHRRVDTTGILAIDMKIYTMMSL